MEELMPTELEFDRYPSKNFDFTVAHTAKRFRFVSWYDLAQTRCALVGGQGHHCTRAAGIQQAVFEDSIVDSNVRVQKCTVLSREALDYVCHRTWKSRSWRRGPAGLLLSIPRLRPVGGAVATPPIAVEIPIEATSRPAAIA